MTDLKDLLIQATNQAECPAAFDKEVLGRTIDKLINVVKKTQAHWEDMIRTEAQDRADRENEAQSHCGSYGDETWKDYEQEVRIDFEAIGKAYQARVEAEGVHVPQEWKTAATEAAQSVYDSFDRPKDWLSELPQVLRDSILSADLRAPGWRDNVNPEIWSALIRGDLSKDIFED